MADDQNPQDGKGNVRVYNRPALADGLPPWVLVIIVLLALAASGAGAWYFLAGAILLGAF